MSFPALAVTALNLSATEVAIPSLFHGGGDSYFRIAVLVQAVGRSFSQLFFIICQRPRLAGLLLAYLPRHDPVVVAGWAVKDRFFIGLIPASIFHFTAIYCGRDDHALQRAIAAELDRMHQLQNVIKASTANTAGAAFP